MGDRARRAGLSANYVRLAWSERWLQAKSASDPKTGRLPTTRTVAKWRSAAGRACPALRSHTGWLGLGRLVFRPFQLLALLAQDGLAAELDFVAFRGQHFDQDLIAFLQFSRTSLIRVSAISLMWSRPSCRGRSRRTRRNRPAVPPCPGRFCHLGHGGNVGNDLDGLLAEASSRKRCGWCHRPRRRS